MNSSNNLSGVETVDTIDGFKHIDITINQLIVVPSVVTIKRDFIRFALITQFNVGEVICGSILLVIVKQAVFEHYHPIVKE